MKIFKRIYLGIIRKPFKSILMFSVIFIIINVLSCSFIINNSTQSTIDEIRNMVGPAVSIESPLTYTGYFWLSDLSNEELHDEYENLNSAVIEISKLDNVIYYDSGNYLLNLRAPNILNGQDDGLLSIYNSNLLCSDGYFYTSIDRQIIFVSNPESKYFENNQYRIIEGRNITQEDFESNNLVAVVSNKFSFEKDGVAKMAEIGDKIPLVIQITPSLHFDKFDEETFNEDDYDEYNQLYSESLLYNKTYEIEIVGIYEYYDPYSKAYPDTWIQVVQPYSSLDYIYNDYYTNLTSFLNQGLINDELAWHVNKGERTYTYIYYKLNDVENIESFTKEAKKIFNKYDVDAKIEVNSDIYLKIAGELESMNLISKLILIVGILASVFVLGIISIMMVKERKFEIGILLTLGESKFKVLIQMLSEELVLITLALLLSFGSTNYFSKVIHEEIKNEYKISELTSSEQSFIGNIDEDKIIEIYDIGLENVDTLSVSFISSGFIMIISAFSLLIILKMNPKEILM